MIGLSGSGKNYMIETINFVKQLCKDEKDVMIGGVMASILPDQVEAATGIRIHVGTLSVPKLEPEYKDFPPIIEQIRYTNEKFGGKKDLLLIIGD